VIAITFERFELNKRQDTHSRSLKPPADGSESPQGINKHEERELARLDAIFAKKNRDHNRRNELAWKKFLADRRLGKPLTEAERHELVERSGPGCLNNFSASISGASAGVRLPSGGAAG
jgi:hypothetical protein